MCPFVLTFPKKWDEPLPHMLQGKNNRGKLWIHGRCTQETRSNPGDKAPPLTINFFPVQETRWERPES